MVADKRFKQALASTEGRVDVAVFVLSQVAPPAARPQAGAQNRSPRDPVGKPFPFDELHDQHDGVVPSLEPVQCGDVGVIELREESSLTLETVQAFLVPGELLGKSFDRDVAVELGISSAVDLTHSAFADRRDDFIRPEAGSGSERHWENLALRAKTYKRPRWIPS